MFSHLKRVNQSYIEHFRDSFTYSLMCFKASFYFLIHSLWPDLYEFDGSLTIKKLINSIQEKSLKNKFIQEQINYS
jgi:hypothetical protein